MGIAVTERAAKRPRTKRVRGTRVLVGTRDLDALVLVGLCGYLSIEQIARDLFPSLDRCRRRLRQMFDAGLVSFAITDSRASTLVSLTAAGIAAVRAKAPELAAHLRRPAPINQAGVEHHLGVVDARLYAAALGERLGVPLVRWANAGGDVAQELGLQARGLRPDGVAEFAAAKGTLRVAVELDAGTEPGSVLTGKLDRYAAVAEAGALDRLWIVAAGPDRQRTLGALVERRGLRGWARVLDHAAVVRRPVALPEEAAGGRDRAEGPNRDRAADTIRQESRDG